MNSWLLHLALVAFFVAIVNNPVLADDSIVLLSPSDKALVEGKLINIIYKAKSDSIDTFRVVCDNNSAYPMPGFEGKFSIYHSSLFLKEGKNIIKIQGLLKKKVVAEKVITVFLGSKLVRQNTIPPPGFKKYTFHTPSNEKACTLCHAEELQAGALSQQNRTFPSCYTCHKRIVDYKFVHGPVAVWACAPCHKQNSEQVKNGVPDPEVIVCQMCHTEDLASWQSEKFGHGPTMAGKCVFCHDPHASNEPFFLKDETTDLCGYCHENKITNMHVVTGFSNRGHPMKQEGGKNGKRYISCASCHNPHAANNVNLLIGSDEPNMKFCRRCHK